MLKRAKQDFSSFLAKSHRSWKLETLPDDVLCASDPPLVRHPDHSPLRHSGAPTGNTWRPRRSARGMHRSAAWTEGRTRGFGGRTPAPFGGGEARWSFRKSQERGLEDSFSKKGERVNFFSFFHVLGQFIILDNTVYNTYICIDQSRWIMEGFCLQHVQQINRS